MADPILKPVSSLVTAFIDAVVAARPSTLQHFNAQRRWYNTVALMRAEALLVQKRLASEVKSARLKTAGEVSFDALRSLCASEFDTSLPSDPQTARGTVTLFRVGGAAGTIPVGTRFNKLADPNAVPLPIAAASYTVAQTVYVTANLPVVTLQIAATAPGAAGNVPSFSNYAAPTSIALSQALYDAKPVVVPPLLLASSFEVASAVAAGGSSGITNSVLIAAAKAYAAGQWGPTDLAAVAGLLRQQSVRHFALFPGAETIPYSQLYFADESWAWDQGWANQVVQSLQDDWIGFGCRVRAGTVTNQVITVAPVIALNDTNDLASTDEIDANVRAAAESYFNDRPDWYTFRLAGLQAAITAADVRIQQCTSVIVNDAVTGNAVPEPTPTFGQPPYQGVLTHYYLTDQNVQSSYTPPT